MLVRMRRHLLWLLVVALIGVYAPIAMAYEYSGYAMVKSAGQVLRAQASPMGIGIANVPKGAIVQTEVSLWANGYNWFSCTYEGKSGYLPADALVLLSIDEYTATTGTAPQPTQAAATQTPRPTAVQTATPQAVIATPFPVATPSPAPAIITASPSPVPTPAPTAVPPTATTDTGGSQPTLVDISEAVAPPEGIADTMIAADSMQVALPTLAAPAPTAIPAPSPEESLDSVYGEQRGARAFVDAQLNFDLFSGNLNIETINFDLLPAVETEATMRALLRQCYELRVKQMPVRISPHLDVENIVNTGDAYFWESALYTYFQDPERVADSSVLITFNYLPGERIANAYLTGDVQDLSQREMEAYAAARAFLESGVYPHEADAVTRERSIFDYIADRCEYWNDDGTYPGQYTDFRTAIGALLDGKANCMGYADAFVMMCRMAGFNVGYMAGETTMPHGWNVIEIGGSWYFVDISNAAPRDSILRYVYFNVGQDMIASTHSYTKEALLVPVVIANDSNYAFGNAAFPELMRIPDEQTIGQLLALADSDVDSFSLKLMVDVISGQPKDVVERLIYALQPSDRNTYLVPTTDATSATFGKSLVMQVKLERQTR